MITANEHTTIPGCKAEENFPLIQGKSNYQLYLDTVPVEETPLTLEEWLLTQKGEKGDKGEQGIQGEKGIQGIQGIQGLTGQNGLDGKSPYQIAVENGYLGTESQFNSELLNISNQHGINIGKETALFVLSAQDSDITVGQKTAQPIIKNHSVSLDDFKLKCTVGPTTLSIILDIKKNGNSIFLTKPIINPGSLTISNVPVLINSTTIFNIGDLRTIHVDQVGAGETGKNLVLTFLETNL